MVIDGEPQSKFFSLQGQYYRGRATRWGLIIIFLLSIHVLIIASNVIMITLMMIILLMSSMRGMRGSRGAYTPRGGGAVNSQQAASGLVISNVSEIQTCCLD